MQAYASDQQHGHGGEQAVELRPRQGVRPLHALGEDQLVLLRMLEAGELGEAHLVAVRFEQQRPDGVGEVRAEGAALDRMRACSPFLSRVLELEPQIAADPLPWLSDPMGRAVIDDPAMPVARRLRIERRRIAGVAALGDLSGTVPLEATMRLLSDFADHALDEAIRSGRVQRGQLVLLEAFGGGFTWGSALLRY